jgi:CRISPR-associated endonuclease Csn1
MKKILGLDLGSASIGWAIIAEETINNNGSVKILGMGSRIVPYEGTEGRDFDKGTGETRNSVRTSARSIRRGYDRYQLRRKYLIDTLKKIDMMPDKIIIDQPKMQLWELRNKAADQEISLKELGRIMLMLNQKRGYKSSRRDDTTDKKDTDYVSAVKNRHQMIREDGISIGQFFYRELQKNPFFRIKENVFPREAYIEEFDRICSAQMKYHPELTPDLIGKIRNEIIYYQRPLKSQKGLVSFCEFESIRIKKDGKEIITGPKVAHKSSPLYQVEKIWESINNIRLSSNDGKKAELSIEQKKILFDYLDKHEKLSVTDLFKILEFKKNSYHFDKRVEKGLQGNITKTAILKCFDGNTNPNDLLRLNLDVIKDKDVKFLYDRKTGEVRNAKPSSYITPKIEKEPFYQLWHTIYSIDDHEECSSALQERFSINKETADRLASLDFSKIGYGNKSVKVLRKILPYLMDGDCYSDAMCYAGYNHSNSLTSDENSQRIIQEKLSLLPKNSLRQPIVEKILNQMINTVNAIIDEYGKPDEIRIELARELKQSKEERNKTDRDITKRQRENEEISKNLAEYGLRATRNNIIKWRLYQEIDDHEKKLNAICIYCGQPISLTEAITGENIDIEHIIPKSRLFDDSQSNKTLAHRHCNRNKNDLTAYDFMKSKSDQTFQEYVERVNMLYSNGIIRKAKRDKLLMTEADIPDDFIDRQLRESQYISKKAKEILHTICRNVCTTTGSVTSELRHLWGWDNITMNLQISKYKSCGLTEIKTWESGHGRHTHKKEVISDWSKRDDQRHHAIDALTIACTKQGYIQYLNTLNAAGTRDEMKKAIQGTFNTSEEKLSLPEKYMASRCPIPVDEIERMTGTILVSFKSGKKVAVKGLRKAGKNGERKVVQKGILIPRGALSEKHVYGKIRVLDKNKPLKYLFENTQLIYKDNIRKIIEERLALSDGDPKKAFSSIKKVPLYINKEKNILLESATCFREEHVIRYKVDINFNKFEKVVDPQIKSILQERLNKFGGKPKEAFRDVQKGERIVPWFEDEGLTHPVRSVRCFTGLSAVVPVRKDEGGSETGFVKPGNNHHIGIYRNASGELQEHSCTFWHAVERKKYSFPVVIQDSEIIWNKIMALPEGTYAESFLQKLPEDGCKLVLSMQQNEMFILGMQPGEAEEAIRNNNYRMISDHLYRVQKLSERDYYLRHHLETQIIDNESALKTKRYYRIRSISSLMSLNPVKVKINQIGKVKTVIE